MLFNDDFEILVSLLIIPVSETKAATNLMKKVEPVSKYNFTSTVVQEQRRNEMIMLWWRDSRSEVFNSPRKIERSRSFRQNEQPPLATLGKRKRAWSFHATGFSQRRDVITKMPPEILDMIFDNMDSLEESLVLGITCRRLWPFALRRYCEWMRGQIGPWAGEKLVTIGGKNNEEGDYPPGLFSESEIDDLNEEGVPEYSLQCLCCREVKDLWQFTMSGFMLEEVVQKYVDASNDFCTGRLLMVELAKSDRLDPAFNLVVKQLAKRSDAYAPADEMWMLRNLTTREFVRAEAIALKPEYICGPFIKKRGFHNVLLARTCWGTNPDKVVEKLNLPVPHKGPWAAHAFEICTVTRHGDHVRSTGEEWSDISEEVAAEMDRLWAAKYGMEWRAVVCEPGFKPATDSTRENHRYRWV